jgi:predicted DNA-binding antitoxin AbrB/MazE fold protein
MAKMIHAIFDGEVLRPEEPVVLPPNTRVLITILEPDVPVGPEYSFLKTARSLNLEGPSDWSERFEEILTASFDEHVE